MNTTAKEPKFIPLSTCQLNFIFYFLQGMPEWLFSTLIGPMRFRQSRLRLSVSETGLAKVWSKAKDEYVQKLLHLVKHVDAFVIVSFSGHLIFWLLCTPLRTFDRIIMQIYTKINTKMVHQTFYHGFPGPWV